MNSQHHQTSHEQESIPEQHGALKYATDHLIRYIRDYDVSKDVGFLDQAIIHGLASVSTCNQDAGTDDYHTAEICLRWYLLGMVYLKRFKHSHHQSDLHKAIASMESAIGVRHAPDIRMWPSLTELKSMISSRLASLLTERYVLNREVSDLNTSLYICKQQIPIVSDASEECWIQQVRTYALSVTYLYDLMKDGSVLTEAMDFLENTVKVLGVTNDRSSTLANLGLLTVGCILLRAGSQYQQFEDMLKLFKESAQLPGQTKHNQIRFAHSHYRGSREVHEVLGRSSAMEESKSILRPILKLRHDPADTSFNRVVIDLSRCHLFTYRTRKSMADLEEALMLARSLVAIPTTTAEDSEVEEDRILVLADCLREDSNHRGFENDISEAIQIVERATECFPSDDIITDRFRESLVELYLLRFEKQRNFQDLDKAIDIQKRLCQEESIRDSALHTLDRQRSPSVYDLNFSDLLFIRYGVTGQPCDLFASIEPGKIFLAGGTSHPHDKDYLAVCHNLIPKLVEAAFVTRDVRYGERALHYADEALNKAQEIGCEDQIILASLLNFRGMTRTFLSTRGPRDEVDLLRLATTDFQKALDISPAGHTARNVIHLRLAEARQLLSEVTNETSHLEASLEALRDAMAGINSADTLRQVTVHRAAGDILRTLARHVSEERSDLAFSESARMYAKAWSFKKGTPIERLRAARLALVTYPPSAIEESTVLGMDVVDSLPELNIGQISRTGQEYILSSLSGIISVVCCNLLKKGRLVDALSVLERGRSVIISQLVDRHDDVHRLRETHERLATRYSTLSTQINGLQLSKFLTDEFSDKMHDTSRLFLQDRYDDCVKEIRGIPGFEGFLRGQPPDELQPATESCFTVVVNISQRGSAVIILSHGSVQHIDLPRLTYEEAETWLKKPLDGPTAMHRSRNKDFTKFLKWLWIFGIKEVLDEIDKLHHDKSVLPRVWWIGSGLASSMPFHAAGTHTVGADLARDSTLLRCVSSYTPSIKILRRSLQRLRAASAGSGAGSGKMLLVSTPETPDANILRGVVEEADEIAKIVTTAMTAEHLCMPSVNQVLSRLGDASIIHFACHGKAADSPSESSLILCRNTRPSGEPAVLEQDHLTVGALASVHHEKARLAYLSACSTAQNKSRQLADEVIHIVSSFQAANFPSVVGCFWPANDAVSKEVAANFYDELLSDGEPKWEEGAVALALHSAVMKARDSNRKAPLNWAPYVHFGC